MLQKGKESIACSRLSDCEKDARVKDTRKYERVRKEKGTVAGKIRGRKMRDETSSPWERVNLLPNSVCGCKGLRARLAIALKKHSFRICVDL